MSIATFYHAGCPVCVSAEQQMIAALDTKQVSVEVVHLGEQPQHITAARAAGVQSVPALVLDDQVFHINFGAAIDDLEGA